MQTPDFFEQIAQGMGNPKKISQWLKGAWPIPADGNPVAAQTKAWISSLESLLHGAEALRQLQLDAVHRTQRRTSRLAKSLGEARSPADTALALQAFAQENMQDAQQYWSVYREIVEDAEHKLLGNDDDSGGIGGTVAHGKARTPAPHQKRARAAKGNSPRMA